MANEFVLDSSAVIALLAGESGKEMVKARTKGAAISTVNIAEIADHAFRHGGTRSGLERSVRELPLLVVEPDFDLALDAAALLLLTRAAGLSLADRFCLALAKRLDRTALTGDRAWSQVAERIGVRVELIR